MTPHRPRDGSSGRTESPVDRQPTGGADFAWPPPADDLDRCGIVSLTGDLEEEARLRVLVRVPDILPPAAARQPARAARPASKRVPAGSRHWGVEQPGAAYPFHVDGDDPMATASAGGEVRRAVVAVAAGLSLAVLSYVQFRSARADANAIVEAVTGATTAAVERRGPEPVMEIPQAVTERIAPNGLGRRLVQRAAEASAADAPVRTTLTRLAADVMDEVRREASDEPEVTPAPAPPPTTVPLPAESRVALAAPPAVPQPTTAIEERSTATPAAAPSPVAAMHVDQAPGDEAHIRAALTQWRTAYTALDAKAASAIWPTVDARALERAFQDLKSQDLRFDRCELTVDGGRAQAACSGRAIYVPRVGNQSPKATPREWTFELKKQDQRWTIASARAS